MSRLAKAAQIGATTCAMALLIAPAAFAAQVITHVPTPEIHVPPPQIHVPTPQTPDASTRLRQIEDSGGGGSGDARAKGPVDKRNPSAKSGSGEPASAIAKYRLFHFIPDTSGGAIYAAILDGGDDDLFDAVLYAYQAAITAAEDALTIAAQCAVNPSLPECASAESVPQAQQNLSDTQNAFMDIYSDMVYLLWVLAYVDQEPTSADSEAEMAAVEAAIQECLASPSTCDATIAQLNAVLEELGVPAAIGVSTPSGAISGEGILYSPPENSFADNYAGYPPPSPSSRSLAIYAGIMRDGWCQSWPCSMP
jgi:hypothetical protein